jgi:hypothetical protein
MGRLAGGERQAHIDRHAKIPNPADTAGTVAGPR